MRLLLRVSADEQGILLYPDRQDSPKGLVVINDGEIVITPNGVELSAGRAVAGLQDVLFVEFADASIDSDFDRRPVAHRGDVSILVPALSASENFVSIATRSECDWTTVWTEQADSRAIRFRSSCCSRMTYLSISIRLDSRKRLIRAVSSRSS